MAVAVKHLSHCFELGALLCEQLPSGLRLSCEALGSFVKALDLVFHPAQGFLLGFSAHLAPPDALLHSLISRLIAVMISARLALASSGAQ
jgi:hypothetical protein